MVNKLTDYNKVSEESVANPVKKFDFSPRLKNANSQNESDEFDNWFETDVNFFPSQDRSTTFDVGRKTFDRFGSNFSRDFTNISRSSERVARLTSCGVVPKRSESAQERAHNGEVNCIAFSHDGSLIATGGNDCIVKLWDAYSLQEVISMRKENVKIKEKDKKKNKEDLLYHKFTRPVTSVAFSYCNDYLAGCSCDLSIKIWRVNRQQWVLFRTLTGHTNIINSWKFLIGPSFIDPLLVTGSSDRTIKFWDKSGTSTSLSWTSAWLCMDTLMLDWVVASGHSDGSIRVWAGRQKTLIHRFPNLHNDAVTSLVLNPINFTITSVGRDHSLKLIDYKENEVLDSQWPDNYVNINHSPHSLTIATYMQSVILASANNKVLIYKLQKSEADIHKQKGKRVQSRSRTMFSLNDFINTFNNDNLEHVLEKVIEVRSDRENLLFADLLPDVAKERPSDNINAISISPTSDIFITAHSSGKLVSHTIGL